MNAIDATDREVHSSDVPPPSLLTIILDTNPHAWAHLSSTLPLSKAVASLLVFINAHLAFSHANRVGVLASHSNTAEWLYPTPDTAEGRPDEHSENGVAQNGGADVDGDVDMTNGTDVADSGPDTNKYPPFARVERALVRNLRRLIARTTPSDLAATTNTLIAGALTTALMYIAKTTLEFSPIDASPGGDMSGAGPGGGFVDPADGTAGTRQVPLTARILVLSVSPDLSSQYIPVMNAIFAAQRNAIPIDVVQLAGNTVFLQQACDATGGIYLEPRAPQGLLQYLMGGLLADSTARNLLVLPRSGEVDFRAACFCHQKVVDVGWVCSVCLSIFCESLTEPTCLTCGTYLKITPTPFPAVVPRKKKKKRKAPGEATGQNTPAGGGTPGPS